MEQSVCREMIADSIELVTRANYFDGVIALAACDKTIPGCLMPISRSDAVGITLYGGTILPGNRPGRDEYLTQQSAFEAGAIGNAALGGISVVCSRVKGAGVEPRGSLIGQPRFGRWMDAGSMGSY